MPSEAVRTYFELRRRRIELDTEMSVILQSMSRTEKRYVMDRLIMGKN